MQIASATVDLWRHVEAMAAQKMTVHAALTELIDNSFDAKATQVRIELANGKFISAKDNGEGIPTITRIVEFGGHEAHRTTRSGMYGVGLKEAALALGGSHSKVKVNSLRDGVMTRGTVEWDKLKSSPGCLTWDSAAAPHAAPGTLIEITPLRMRVPEGKDRDRLLAELGYTYSIALRDGRSIDVLASGRSYVVKPYVPPMLEDVVGCTFEVRGKSAKLHAGIVPTGQFNEWPGVTYCHGWRVVKRASRAGCGDFSHTRLFAMVDLSDEWTRAKNKDDLIDADDLYAAVGEILAPLLKRAESQTREFTFTSNIADLEAALNSALGLGSPDLKAKRGDGEQEGTQEPTGKGRKHKRAKNTQPGSRFGGKHGPAKLKVLFNEGWSEGRPIGSLDTATSKWCVTLYRDHPMLARAMNPWNGDALLMAAMSVLVIDRKQGEKQPGLWDSDDALTSLARLTATVRDVSEPPAEKVSA